MPPSTHVSRQVGGGPAGGANQVHEVPNQEFGGPEHPHAMSPLEIGIMVGVILVFATVIGSLFYYRARKIKKMQEAQAAQEQEQRPGTQDGGEMEDRDDDVKDAAVASSGSFAQLFGRKWLGIKGGKFGAGLSLVVPLLMKAFVTDAKKIDDVPLEHV